MSRKLYKMIVLFLSSCILLSCFAISASALSWDGSSTGGGGSGDPAGANGYAVRFTENNCIGYRFSVVNKAGGNKVSKVIDVFRNTTYGNMAYGSAYKFGTKYNKKQIINNQNSGFSTSQIANYCYQESSMSFASSLPAPSGMGTWQLYTNNLNPVLYNLGIGGGIGSLKNGDKIIVEPLYDVRLQGIYHSITVSEIAIYGKYILGANSNGGSSGNPASWGFISAYTNRHYPNELYTPDGQGLWTGVGPLSNRATFYTIINSGYGVGIAYTETKPDFDPALTVRCVEAWPGNVGNRNSRYGTSYGSAFGNYEYANGYPTKDDKVWFSVNYPAYEQPIRVRLSVKMGNNRQNKEVVLDRNNSSSQWFDVQFSDSVASQSSIKVMNNVEYYVVTAGIDWIDDKGDFIKVGAWYDFYVPVKPKINRYQVSLYDYAGDIAAEGNLGSSSGAVYVGQTTFPQYAFTSENTWTSTNNLSGTLFAWKNGSWEAVNGNADMSVNNVGINQNTPYQRYSSLNPYRVQDNSKNTNGSNRIPFELISEWTKDIAHTKESTLIDIPIVKADVELLDIRLIDENDYYITGQELWAHQTVTPQYVYRNNTSVKIYVEGYDSDDAKFSGVYAIAPGETILVNGKQITIPNSNSFSVWGGVYLEGAGRSTSWETNGDNNELTKRWNIKSPLSIESLEPNSIYREGTEVITSFKVKNAYLTQFIPGSNIKVKFTAQNGAETLYSTTKSGVVIPGNNEQLVYFKWTVPRGLNNTSVTVQGELLDNNVIVDTAKRKINTGKITDSQPPDTGYEKAKPTGWSQPNLPSSYATQATWSEWIYADGKFQLKSYGLKIAQASMYLSPDSSTSSGYDQNNNMWKIKSGYGIMASFTPSRAMVNGYLAPESSAYTAIQNGDMQLPEFGFSNEIGKYRTLERMGTTFRFVPNTVANGRKVHFTPIWYPDGYYQATCYFYDLWTPAGMVAAQLDTDKMIVSGNMYDDWYIGRR